jgi:alpha-1,3-mannosyltransferase
MSSMSNWIRSGYRLVLSLLTDPKHFWKLAALVIIGDAVLTQLIIMVIPCEHPVFSFRTSLTG